MLRYLHQIKLRQLRHFITYVRACKYACNGKLQLNIISIVFEKRNRKTIEVKSFGRSVERIILLKYSEKMFQSAMI